MHLGLALEEKTTLVTKNVEKEVSSTKKDSKNAKGGKEKGKTKEKLETKK